MGGYFTCTPRRLIYRAHDWTRRWAYSVVWVPLSRPRMSALHAPAPAPSGEEDDTATLSNLSLVADIVLWGKASKLIGTESSIVGSNRSQT